MQEDKKCNQTEKSEHLVESDEAAVSQDNLELKATCNVMKVDNLDLKATCNVNERKKN